MNQRNPNTTVFFNQKPQKRVPIPFQMDQKEFSNQDFFDFETAKEFRRSQFHSAKDLSWTQF